MTEKETTYNGWSNYDTWSVALFIDNEEFSYTQAREIALDNVGNFNYEFEKEEALRFLVEDLVKVESLNPFALQLILSCLSNVNWKEVLKHYQEE